MKTFAKQSNRDLSDVFNETALIMHLQPNVIEKDFWVCFLIDHIFNDCKYKDAFVFKGEPVFLRFIMSLKDFQKMLI